MTIKLCLEISNFKLRYFSSDVFTTFLLRRDLFHSSDWNSRGSSVSEVNLIQWLTPHSLYYLTFPWLLPLYVLAQGLLVVFL